MVLTSKTTSVGIGYIENRTYIKKYGYKKEYVQNLIKQALFSGGLGILDKNIPCLDIVKPGYTVLLKPNWVNHYNSSKNGLECLITHEVFIECVLEEVLKCNPAKVIIGDSPIQSCNFNKLSDWQWLERMRNKYNIPIEIKDYRRSHFFRDPITSKASVKTELIEKCDYILFDLAENSSLEEITSINPNFRVSDYDHRSLNENHQKRVHRYLMTKDPFIVDVIINLPKLKTHQKAGLTGALKNLVGLNGDKDYLPHHRFGGSFEGGDCYYGKSKLKKAGEILNDLSNQNIGNNKYVIYKNINRVNTLLRKILGINGSISGSWYGNDTVWRMTVDLNKILLYGTSNGTISNNMQRKIFSITDAIIAGDHDGPLKSEPVYLGMVTFGSSSAIIEYVHGLLMGFEPFKIPLIKGAFNSSPSLTSFNPKDIEVKINSKKVLLKELINYSYPFTPAQGWLSHIERI